jgi:signal transduction histidine kinase/ActR/RegA family two-component response regulator
MIQIRRGAGLRTWPARIGLAIRVVLADISWAPFLAALIAFGVDILTPRAIIDFYIVPILLCLRARSPRAPLYVAALCTPLMAIGFGLSTEMGSEPTVSLINQLFMLAVDWGSALVIASMLKTSAAAEKAQRELERADRHKDEFLAILSHELRNPLAPIRTAADILAAPGVTSEKLRWAGGLIRRQSARMAGLLDDLLDVTRIAEGKLALSLQPVSFTGIIEAAIEVARPALDRKSHRLSVSLPAEAAMLRADALRLSQVFSNLLSNAAKYTDPGGRIELNGAVEGGTLTVSVRDNGIGIPPEALTRVFGLFSQMEGGKARAEGGLGIGLALAKGIVELHRGTIEARSAGRGHGSEFIVVLPLCAREPPAALPVEAQPPATDVGVHRVLIADDNRDAADSLATLLGLAGHEMCVAYDGEAALSAARDFHPDVAVLDIDMPGLDGYALAEALRTDPWAGELFIIAVTGLGDQKNAPRAEEAGFDAHMIKPIDPDRIKALLRERKKFGGGAPDGRCRETDVGMTY